MPSDVEITAMETFLDVMHPFVQISRRGKVNYNVICEATIIQADQQTPCHYYSHLKRQLREQSSMTWKLVILITL